MVGNLTVPQSHVWWLGYPLVVLAGDSRALRSSSQGSITQPNDFRGHWRGCWDPGPCSFAAPMQSLQQQSLGISETAHW